jgi:glycosyltransferase involved in cell wall biosynthesis
MALNIWLLKAGEILPNEKREGLLRTGFLAEVLRKRGHRVTWWSSTFHHFKKKHLFDRSTALTVEPGYELRLLHANAYERNISFRRFRNHYLEAKEFRRLAPLEQKPDVIVAALPTLDLALAATRYARANGIPIVVDIRDLWPEIFVDILPGFARPLGRLALLPLYRQLGEICRGATALSAVSPEILDYALARSGRERSVWDRHFWLGSSITPISEVAREAARVEWRCRTGKQDLFMVTFIGAFSGKLELETVIEAARLLAARSSRIHFVLAGAGDTFAGVKDLAAGLSNVTLPGWVDRGEVPGLLAASSVGLAPFRSRQDFMWSLPTKAIEYMSAGLPVVSSLKGSLATALKRYDCGVTYENGDAASLAEALLALEADPVRARALAQNSAAVGTREFSGAVVYGAMADHVEKFVESRRGKFPTAANQQLDSI